MGLRGRGAGGGEGGGVGQEVMSRGDNRPPTAGAREDNTAIDLQPAQGEVWDPQDPLAVFITIDEAEARGELITLRYWRETIDDVNMDGIADEDEYLSQQQPLTSGMTGQQQVQFAGLDVSSLPFNSMVHLYIDGTDWAGYSYQDGGTGGGPGAENAWASLVAATDEPTNIITTGFDLDRELG